MSIYISIRDRKRLPKRIYFFIFSFNLFILKGWMWLDSCYFFLIKILYTMMFSMIYLCLYWWIAFKVTTIVLSYHKLVFNMSFLLCTLLCMCVQSFSTLLQSEQNIHLCKICTNLWGHLIFHPVNHHCSNCTLTLIGSLYSVLSFMHVCCTVVITVLLTLAIVMQTCNSYMSLLLSS